MHSQAQTDTLVRDGIVESFWTEFKTCWAQLPNKGLFFGLLGAWVLLFQFLGNGTFGYVDTASLFQWMWLAYNGRPDSSDGHANVVPFVVLVLFWWKRKDLLAVEFKLWWPAMAVVLLALVLHVVCYAVQQPRLSIAALFIGIYGLMGVAWGPQWLRRSFFPFVLFVFSMPLGLQAEIITFPLRLFVTVLVEFITSNLLGFDVVRVGTGLYDASMTYQFDVAPACSGIRSLAAIFLLAIVYGYILFRGSWRWLVMVTMALPLAVLGNTFRLLIIVLAGEFGGQQMGNSAHDSTFFSMLPYVPAIVGLALLGRWLKPKSELLDAGGGQ